MSRILQYCALQLETCRYETKVFDFDLIQQKVLCSLAASVCITIVYRVGHVNQNLLDRSRFDWTSCLACVHIFILVES